MPQLTYLLPLRNDDDLADELVHYVRRLATAVDDVIVVDGSSTQAVARHRCVLGTGVRVIAPEEATLMGKVGNVMTGVRHARNNKVVIADDDVRYTLAQLERMVALLDGAEVVRPQNFFTDLRWHTRVDTARTLLARATGGDWPGTLGVLRDTLLHAGGYRGDVMFENLELVRTVRAAGGRELVALDLLVQRRPPTTSHFLHQQVRQAYDEFARPERLLVSLAIAPGLVYALWTRKRFSVGLACISVVALAECGRRRAGGRRAYRPWSTLIAPLWLVWRSLCSWAAIGARLRGGVKYRGVRIKYAARAPRPGSRASSSSGTR